MAIMESGLWANRAIALFRIVSALLFMQHGLQKLFAFPIAYRFGSTAVFSFMWFTGVLELTGAALLLIGLFTRPTAFILSGMMAVAYFIGHASRGFYPIVNGGELAIMFCFGFLLLAATGGGSWSVDRLRATSAAG